MPHESLPASELLLDPPSAAQISPEGTRLRRSSPLAVEYIDEEVMVELRWVLISFRSGDGPMICEGVAIVPNSA